MPNTVTEIVEAMRFAARACSASQGSDGWFNMVAQAGARAAVELRTWAESDMRLLSLKEVEAIEAHHVDVTRLGDAYREALNLIQQWREKWQRADMELREANARLGIVEAKRGADDEPCDACPYPEQECQGGGCPVPGGPEARK